MNIIAFIFISFFIPASFAASPPPSEDFWQQAKQALYQGEIKQVGEILFNQLKKETKGREFPYASYGEVILGKGEEAMELVSCVVLDMLALVEREFGQNGQAFSKQMQQIFAEVERLKPQVFSKPGDIEKAVYQRAHETGVRSAHLSCNQVNQEYAALKKEVEKLFSPLTGKSNNRNGRVPPAVLENTERTFYHTVLSTRYETVKNKVKWKPLD